MIIPSDMVLVLRRHLSELPLRRCNVPKLELQDNLALVVTPETSKQKSRSQKVQNVAAE